MQRSSWKLESLSTAKVLEWVERTTPESGRVRHTRDSELYFIDKSAMTFVVSPEEVRCAALRHVHEAGAQC